MCTSSAVHAQAGASGRASSLQALRTALRHLGRLAGGTCLPLLMTSTAEVHGKTAAGAVQTPVAEHPVTRLQGMVSMCHCTMCQMLADARPVCSLLLELTGQRPWGRMGATAPAGTHLLV